MSAANLLLAIDAITAFMEIQQSYAAIIQKARLENRDITDAELDELRVANQAKRAAWDTATRQ